MQPKIPLFSQPPFVKTPTPGIPGVAGVLSVLDLRDDSEQDVTRLVTLYAQFYNATPTGENAQVLACLINGDIPAGLQDTIEGVLLVDSNPAPVRILDQYPVRGDVNLVAFSQYDTAAVSEDAFVIVFGYYTIAGESGQRFNVLDERALQPVDTVPESASFPIDTSPTGSPIHVTHPLYIDEITVDVNTFYVAEGRVYAEAFPGDFIVIREIVVPPENSGGFSLLARALNGIPLRNEGRLMCSSGEGKAIPANGFFVRY